MHCSGDLGHISVRPSQGKKSATPVSSAFTYRLQLGEDDLGRARNHLRGVSWADEGGGSSAEWDDNKVALLRITLKPAT